MPHALATTYVTDGTKSIPLSQLSPEAWTPVDDDEVGAGRLSARTAQRLVPIVYRAIDIRAKAVARMPFVLEHRGKDITQDEAYAALVARLRQLLYLTEAALCLSYQAYWELSTNVVGKQLTPYWLATGSITPDIDVLATRPDKALRGFRRSGGRAGDLKPDRVCYFWGPSAAVEIGPDPLLAPVATVLAAAGLLHQLDRYASGFFTRGGIKMTLLTVEGNPPKDEKDKLKSWWDQMVTGVRSAWRSVVVSAKVKPEVIGSDPKDAAATDLSKLSREDIAMGMGVPMALLMLSAPLAGGTADAERLNFYDFTIVPEWEGVIAPPLNEQYLSRLDMRLVPQPRKLEVYQAAEAAKAQGLQTLVGDEPIMFADEARAMLDLPSKADYLKEHPEAAPPEPPPPPPVVVAPPAAIDQREIAQRAIALDRWQTKALNRLKKDGSAACVFDSPHLDGPTQTRVTAALGDAADADAVKALFGEEIGR